MYVSIISIISMYVISRLASGEGVQPPGSQRPVEAGGEHEAGVEDGHALRLF